MAQANERIAQARVDQARGALLPQIQLTGALQANKRKYEALNGPYQNLVDRQRFNSDNAQLQLSQGLIRPANVIAWRQSQFMLEQSAAQRAYALQEASSRLVTSWLDVMQARDETDSADKQVLTARQQWQTQDKARQRGLIGFPDSEKALADLRRSEAQLQLAKAQLQAKQNALEELTGAMPGFVPPHLHKDAIQRIVAVPALAYWMDKVLTGNSSIRAGQLGVQAAQAEVSKQRAGHYPTLDLVASYGHSKQQAGSIPSQPGYRQSQWQAGLQLNWPLFSGGTQSARVSEAVAALDKTEQELEQTQRQLTSTTQQAWHGFEVARLQMLASQAAVESARWAIQLAQKGMRTGLKTELDLLQAQQDYLKAQAEQLQAQYATIKAWFRLKSLEQPIEEALIQQVQAMMDEPVINFVCEAYHEQQEHVCQARRS